MTDKPNETRAVRQTEGAPGPMTVEELISYLQEEFIPGGHGNLLVYGPDSSTPICFAKFVPPNKVSLRGVPF
ncbi:hypothetical protein AB0I54_39180 [Streptomyces sp. NPDC050625]|uniref:hypothetical protein n=1 Tax=Streptomyces sp. NPDC050625 TaxID=3154629 RepID=UPI0034247314